MNRFNYRAWDGAKFLEWDQLKWYPLRALANEDDCCNLIFQQSIGLADKNGKEIYEGDIVCACSSDNKYLSTVEWDESDGQWGFLSIRSKNMQFTYNLSYRCSRWEIVGNIFENPELLK